VRTFDEIRADAADKRAFGTAGVSHCGSWTPWKPGTDRIWVTRLVCTLAAGHRGHHWNRFYELEWA